MVAVRRPALGRAGICVLSVCYVDVDVLSVWGRRRVFARRRVELKGLYGGTEVADCLNQAVDRSIGAVCYMAGIDPSIDLEPQRARTQLGWQLQSAVLRIHIIAKKSLLAVLGDFVRRGRVSWYERARRLPARGIPLSAWPCLVGLIEALPWHCRALVGRMMHCEGRASSSAVWRRKNESKAAPHTPPNPKRAGSITTPPPPSPPPFPPAHATADQQSDR